MKYEIDKLAFGYNMIDNIKYTDVKEKPEIGVYVYGTFLEGAKWNFTTHLIDYSNPKELYIDFPIIHLVPSYLRVEPTEGIYKCPLYKVLSRAGTLMTTGHSTNFVLYAEIPTDQDPSTWVKAGVAMFLALKQ